MTSHESHESLHVKVVSQIPWQLRRRSCSCASHHDDHVIGE
nr:hypothetical protein [Candidatus Sigynarchaeota archaeon]